MALIAAIMLALVISERLCARFTASGFLPDQPTDRSSHIKTTPRSGGAAMFAGWAGGMGLLYFSGVFADSAAGLLILLVLCLGAAGIGLADDKFRLSPLMKFVLQCLLAFLFVMVFGGFQTLPLPFIGSASLGVAGYFLGGLFIVGFMNAFNFMDGLNGIAAGGAGIVLGVLAIASASYGAFLPAAAALIAMGGIGGFLFHNFPHGRIFMGDAGSHGLGFLIAVLAVLSEQQTGSRLSSLFVPIAMAPFLFDTAFTLYFRHRRGCAVTSPHREHLYQLLNRLGYSHQWVTIVYALMVLFCGVSVVLLANAALFWRIGFLLFVYSAGILPGLYIYRKAKHAGLLQGPVQQDR